MQGSALFVTAFFGVLPPALGHGLLTFPPLRGGTASRDETGYCPHCGNGAGVCGDGGQWGTGSDLLNFARGPVTSLSAGEAAEFQVQVTAHHRGFFEFRICEQHLDKSVANPEACLNEHRLRRAPLPAGCTVGDAREDCQPLDTRHPERWYLPPMRQGGLYSMKYTIPADLRCTSCTLQWQWFTANSCLPGADTGCYWADFADQGWNQTAWCGTFCGECDSSAQRCASGAGEEFRNCADIAVVEKTEGATPATPDSETQVEQEAEPEVEPVDETTPSASASEETSSTPSKPSSCGSCSACMWSNGLCYTDASKSYCEAWSDNVWCGASLVQVQRHKTRFLGLGLIQDGASSSRVDVGIEL